MTVLIVLEGIEIETDQHRQLVPEDGRHAGEPASGGGGVGVLVGNKVGDHYVHVLMSIHVPVADFDSIGCAADFRAKARWAGGKEGEGTGLRPVV